MSPALLLFRPCWLALVAFPVGLGVEEPGCRKPAAHQVFELAKLLAFFDLAAAHLATAGDGGGHPVGIEVAKEIVALDYASEDQGSILGIVGVDPFDFVRSEGAASSKYGLTKLVPQILVWPVLLAGPSSAPETVNDFLVVHAYSAVP